MLKRTPLVGSEWLKVSSAGGFLPVREALRQQENTIQGLLREIAELKKNPVVAVSPPIVLTRSQLPSFLITTYIAQSANYTVTAADHIVFCTTGGGGITITLPASIVIGQQFIIQKVDSGAGALTIGRNANNINGAAADKTIGTQWDGCIIIGNTSTNWSAMTLPALP